MAELGLLREAGAVAFTDGKRTPWGQHPADAPRAQLCARIFGGRIVQHPEDPSLAEGGAATEGELATRLGLPSIPLVAEAILVARDIRLARLTGGALHFAHISTAESVELIRRGKARGPRCHLRHRPALFRPQRDRASATIAPTPSSPPRYAPRPTACASRRRRSIDGTIDAIASDHQPRDADDKRLPFAQAAAGGTGLATLLGVTLAQDA